MAGEVLACNRGQAMSPVFQFGGDEEHKGFALYIGNQPCVSCICAPFDLLLRIKRERAFSFPIEVDPVDDNGEIQLVGKLDYDFNARTHRLRSGRVPASAREDF